jgi:vancomycin resistance protein YoaR
MATSTKIKRGQVIVLGVMALVFVCLAVAFGSVYDAYSKWHQSQKIVPHYFVQGENIGGLKPAIAKKHLQNRFGKIFVTIHAPDRDFRLSLSQLGGELQYDYAVRQAKKFGRSGNSLANVWDFCFSSANEKRDRLPLRWNTDKLRKTMWTVAYSYNEKPKDAHLEIRNGEAQVVAEQLGRTLDVPQSIKLIQQKYFPGWVAVSIVAKTQEPKIKAADLQGQDVILGKYTTRFNPGDEGRTANVKLAAQAVEGKVLMPGDVFSLNGSTGERTPAKGYQVAKIFVTLPDEEKAKIVDGVGGGVCQVSSTLFNAVRITNGKRGDHLKIVERYHHSLPVHYVPDGMDATVAWPYKDFRFRNDYSFPIYLRTEINGSHLTISVWGRIPISDAAQYSTASE